MAYQTLDVRPDDGEPYELKVEARDALMWEKTGKGNPSIIEYLAMPSMTEVYRLAYLCAKRQRQYAGTLKEFEEAHDIVIAYREEDDREPDPTQPAPSAGD